MPAEFAHYFHEIVEIGCAKTTISANVATATAAHETTAAIAVAVASTIAVVFALSRERRQRVVVVVSEMPHRPKVTPTRDVEQPRGVALQEPVANLRAIDRY